MKAFRNFFILSTLFIVWFILYYICTHGLHGFKDWGAMVACLVGALCAANLAHSSNEVIKEDMKKNK